MPFPETDGPEDADLFRPFVYRGHHCGKDDERTDEEYDRRYAEGKSLEMPYRLHPRFHRLLNGGDFCPREDVAQLLDHISNRASVAECRNLNQGKLILTSRNVLHGSQGSEKQE